MLHVIVCVAAGSSAARCWAGWSDVLKAGPAPHEVIVTIMLNYVMYDLLSYLLWTRRRCSSRDQTNQTAPIIAVNDANLPHVGGPPPQVGTAF